MARKFRPFFHRRSIDLFFFNEHSRKFIFIDCFVKGLCFIHGPLLQIILQFCKSPKTASGNLAKGRGKTRLIYITPVFIYAVRCKIIRRKAGIIIGITGAIHCFK